VVTRVKPRYSKNNSKQPKIVFIESLGCSKNLVKSESIASLLHCNGWSFCSASDSPMDADMIVVNTCGFIKSARLEAEASLKKYESPLQAGKKVLVVGCYASRFTEALRKKYPQCNVIENRDPVLGIQEALDLNPIDPIDRILSTDSYVFLEIATGCSKSCSYCLIPSIQGIYKSKTRDLILAEVRKLLDQKKIQEIVLIAQDTASYGADLDPKESLLSLVTSLSQIKEIQWIRIMYMYPTLPLETIHAILSLEKVIPYLDMPLQHFSPAILSLMHRPGNIKPYMDQLFEYKTKHPALTLRSTFMVGFPGETIEDFEMLKQGLKNYPFDRAGFFAYSREKETEAYYLTNQVSSSTKAKRLKEAYQVQEIISKKENQKWIGLSIPVLLERYETQKRQAFGRTYREAPDVDPEVIISGNPFHLKRKIGSIQTMKITSASAYEIQGSLQE
jgi:ribosomal protein S12 methylthiotransferase